MWNLSEILKESCFYNCVGCIFLTCPYLNHITKSAKLLNNTDILCEKTKGVCPTVNSTEWNSPTVSCNSPTVTEWKIAVGTRHRELTVHPDAWCFSSLILTCRVRACRALTRVELCVCTCVYGCAYVCVKCCWLWH